ncbi:uncharacterized protein CTRU02_206342 [Colletotrichum truncatum]|uniref:Uncharacterized protein n=1 Tax=Colletotrichum truncatum TaxID=5467 RepID=A0ACC3Z6N6_COLTU|nr:uncharacterized protein CTRU02_09821 [Colletotrichum truncatum]KAF6788008.1 hypothetical protein CTRU02_09821 [Colletotrichum truncatum]
MVSFKLILNALAASAAVVIAAPVEESSGSVLVARDQVTIFMCEDTRYRGLCRDDVIQTGSCYNAPSEFIDRISSIRNNDRESTTCTWYRERDCRGDTYRNQEDRDLGDGNGRFNDAIRSYECNRK